MTSRYHRSLLGLGILSGVLLVSILAPSASSRPVISASEFPIGSGSWNPNVSCASPWIVRITDITDNMTGSASLTNSLFNPGITSPVGFAKRWLTPGATPLGWISPGPSCTITNSHGVVAMFVEIDNIKFPSTRQWEDCRTSYDPVNGGTAFPSKLAYKGCDSTANAYDPAIVANYGTSCTSASDPTCYGRIHTEIDGDWQVAGYAGPTTSYDNNVTLAQAQAAGSSIDIQGFVFWDPDHITASWHGFSGWEIHPLTAWRIHQLNPDFTISASPTSLTVPAGSSATSTITLSSLNGFSGTINVGATSSPTGPSLSLSPTSVSITSGGTASSGLTVSSATVGSYTVTVTGTSGSLSHSVPLNVKVVDFSASASPSSITVSPGSSATSTISLASLGGFTGPVSLSSTVSPTGPTGSLNPTSVTLSSGGTATSLLTVSTTSSTPTGNYTITVTGTSGSLSHSTAILVSVKTSPDFSISANPTSFNIQLGGAASSTITVTSLNGFTGTVNLSTSQSPITINPPIISLSSNSLNLTSGSPVTTTLTISTSSNTTPGSYTITVTGSSGSLTHSVAISLTVNQPADFSLTRSPSTLRTLVGPSASSTVTATSLGGFTGTVSLTFTSVSGLTVSLNPTSLTLTSGASANSTLTVSSTTIGNYTVTVTGTSGSLIHTVSVLVIVSDFSISMNPSSLTIPQSSTATSTITVAGLNCFTGTVTLSVSVSTTSLKTSLSTSSLTITSGGSSTSILNVKALKKAPLGTYSVTITAISGGVSHSTTLTVTVVA